MVRLELAKKTEKSHRTLFQERYDWLLSWALKLTKGDRSEAEDVLHDAYVQFVRLAPELDRIENVDAYLNRMVRNLHLSKLMRRSRVPMVHIDALAYDNLHLSIDAVDPFKLSALQSDLHGICDWACARREKTRAASVLLLRYFLGYLPSEIAKLCNSNRQIVEKSLQLARREMRSIDLLETNGKATRNDDSSEALPSSVDRAIVTIPAARGFGASVGTVELEVAFQRKIFAEPVGSCIHIETLKPFYAAERQPTGTLDTLTLGHLSSCLACLDRVNRLLGLPTIAERADLEERGGGTPKSKGPGGRSKRLIARGERSIRQIDEHRPSQLAVQVDAGRRTSMAVSAVHNSFDVEVGRTQPIGFIEVFSEQDVRLLYLPVTPPNDGGDFEQNAVVYLSEERAVHLRLCFSQPRPIIALTYDDPHFLAMQGSDNGLEVVDEPTNSSFERSGSAPAYIGGRISSWHRWAAIASTSFRRVPRLVTVATAVLLIVLLPVLQTKYSTAQAELLLAHVDRWQMAVTGGSNDVLHRTFDYVERSSQLAARQPALKHRRVEVWRQPHTGRKISRIYDDDGRLIASSKMALPLTADLENAWLFEPSADDFRVLAGKNPARKIVDKGTEIEVIARNVKLDVDKTSYRPVRLVLDLPSLEVEFDERSTDTVPLNASPFAPASAVTAPAPHSSPVSSTVDLDAAEVRLRSTLHDLHADLGEDIHIAKTGRGLQVYGIIPEASRRTELSSAIHALPGVSLSLRSPEEAAAASAHGDQRVISFGEDVNEPPLLEDWLRSRYPDEQERSKSVDRILGLADECLSRSHALHELAVRYGTLEEASVHNIAADHSSHLLGALKSIEVWLAQLPGAASAGDDTAVPSMKADASDTTRSMVAKSQDMERGLADLLAARAAQPKQTPSSSEATLARCRRDILDIERAAKSIQ